MPVWAEKPGSPCKSGPGWYGTAIVPTPEMTRQSFAPLLLRLSIGPGFMVHGWTKISRGTAGFGELLAFRHVPLPHLNAVIGPYVELLGGLAIVLGAYLLIVAIPLVFTMLVAMIYVQGYYGYSSVNTLGLSAAGPIFGPPGVEINLLYIAGILSLMITGAGGLSIDALRQRRKNPANHKRLYSSQSIKTNETIE
jgi:putative oxidoreductase